MAYSVARYGWKPDLPDHRDHRLSVAPPRGEIPALVDLRGGCPPVYDQGQIGSCTANALAALFEYERRKQADLPDARLSRLFLYYNERKLEGTTDQDAGAQIRDGIKSLANTGICLESEWPYEPAKFAVEPPPDCYFNAVRDRAIDYARVPQTVNEITTCLAAGFPIAFGFSVYDNFESDEVATTGILSLPDRSDEPVGGHAVMMCGYDQAKRLFLVRNSWGAAWGQGGYFWMPYDYALNGDLADDLWTLRLVSS